MKSFALANKWLLLSVALFGCLLFYMASLVPLNYWHHSKFGHEADFTFNDYFPLIHLFGSILSNANAAPINDLNFQNYNYLAAFFSLISFGLFLSVVLKKFKSQFLVIASFALIGQFGFLWLSVISLNLAIASFGVALLFWTLHYVKDQEKTLLTVPLFVLAFAAIIGASAFWPLFVFSLILFTSIHKQNRLKILLSIALGFGIVFLIDPHFLQSYSQYFKTNLLAFFTFNSQTYVGSELPAAYALSNILKYTSPAILLMLLSVLAFFKLLQKQWHNPLFTLLLFATLVVVLQPNMASKANYAFYVFTFPLALLGLQGLHKISNKLKKPNLKWLLFSLLILSNFKGVLALFSLSPYQYLEPAWPFAKMSQEIANNNGEYLNIAGIAEVQKTLKNIALGDTIGLNFTHNVAFAEGSFIPVDYFKRDLKAFSIGVFTRLAFSSGQQKSPGFPPSNYTSSTTYKGITLALTCKPLRKIKKAFSLIGQREYGEAVTAFKVLKDTISQNVEIWHGLAKSQFLFNQWDDALSSCQMGLAINPDHLKLKVLLGEIYRKQNKNEKAISQWKSGLKIWQSFGRAHWLLGEYYYSVDSFDLAQDYFINAKYCPGAMSIRAAKSLELMEKRTNDPRFANGIEAHFIKKLNAFGNINDSSLSRLNQIIDEVKSFIDLDSTNAQLRSHLGIAYMMKNDFSRAALAFEKAIEINPNYPQMRDYLSIARINWGAEKFEEDSLDAAIFHFTYALDYSPNNEEARANLSVCYNEMATKALSNNELEDAYAVIKAAIFYNQKNPVSFIQMGRLQLAINQTDSAEIAFNQAYLIDNNNQEVIEELIKFYDKKGDAYKVKIFNDRLREAKKRTQMQNEKQHIAQ